MDADDQDVTYQEIISGAGSSKTGYRKIELRRSSTEIWARVFLG
jgi:hypothetical protein